MMMNMDQLYYKHPYMQSFKARVLSCTENGGHYEIVLEETIFYPEGGGQPSDVGHIGECYISHVYWACEHIIHISDKPLEENVEYDAEINWQRRFDHMQHHSAEHLLSGIAHKLYGADNVGFGIGESHVTIDFNVELSHEDIVNLEVLSNDAVYRNLPIKTEYFNAPPEFSYRSKKELSGTIRIVSIDSYDICACAGTQLSSTGEIGLIKIVSFGKYKSGTRLYLLCGQRALRDYQVKQENLHEISTLLSVKTHEAAEHVARLHEEKEALAFELMATKYEIIDMESEKLLLANSGDEILLFEEKLSSEEMKRYTANLLAKFKIIAIFSGDDENGFQYMITSNILDLPTFIKNMNAELNGKGGGKGTAFGHVRATKLEIEQYFEGGAKCTEK